MIEAPSIGAPAAERDELLLQCFVGSNLYDSITSGGACVLLGNRGSGKSAIFQKFKDQTKGTKQAIIQISPEDYSYEIVSSTLASELEGSWNKQSSFAAAWKYVLLVRAFIAVRDCAPSAKTVAYKEIHNFLRQKFINNQFDIIDQFISYMQRFEGIKLGSYNFEKKGRELQQLYKLEEIHRLIKYFNDLAGQTPVIILIDELDRGWDASEDARLFVAGLFQAAMWLNSISPNFRVLISLRRELYDNIPELFDDAQKYRDVLRYLTWSEPKLKELAALRLRQALALEPSLAIDDIWASVFEDVLAYRNTHSFHYIVDRTLYRPREIILFVNECLARMPDDGSKIDYPIIAEAEKVYSSDRTQDICSEYRFQMPGLADVFNHFRGRVYNLSREELENDCIEIILRYGAKYCWLDGLDENTLIERLWAVGFLKALAIGGEKGVVRAGSRWVGYHQSSQLDIFKIEAFQIHPMFRTHLSLKEK